ncbi:hypothetical protein QTG54_013393 [Skeletonema marinoi]|uniref:Sulfotransferase domain-containing protein n=1 Tax=Skeletonema marinoi TaxID=267567 RepID=A0AAD8XZ44_9STRA|nr:hypothetical protein QTG54_013393 [Skeletonema marinoi]
MTAATTTPPERRNTPQSLRHLLFVCWLLLILQIWFASESDEFLDPQQHHYYDGVMDLPREEVISRADDGMSESNYVQFGDGNVVATREDGGESVVEMETVDALSAAVVQSDEATMTDVQNYTQDVNESDDLSTDVQNHTKDVTTYMANQSDDDAYDCSIVWVRIPKTASTTIYESFMRPLATWFMNTHIGPNTCISQPGGCSLHWNTSLGGTNESTDNFETACMGASQGACFEFDNTTRTTNFGPPSEISEILRKRLLLIGQGKEDLRRQFDEDEMFVRRVADDRKVGVFSPSVNDHVGLHTSLINSVLPPKPLIFCAFREPKERLLSSFHHGIIYGADKPGQVQSCNLQKAGWVRGWRQRVATARRLAITSNTTIHYQTLLRYYLEKCKDASWNVYTQFLDPDTKDVSVALHNLEQYVIVGLQTNITETIQLWTNTTRRNCRHREDFDQFRLTLLSEPFRETYTEKREKVSIAVKNSVELVTPNFTLFDDDLKDMFNAYIKEDTIIYQRAKELYAEQLEMMLNY